MRELRIGDRVAVKPDAGSHIDGMHGVIVDVYGRERVGQYRVEALSGHVGILHRSELEPLPADIPRERVADLHAAARKRLKQLDPYWDLERRARADELATFAEALRLLLEPADE